MNQQFPGQGKSVDVGNVEAELSALWGEAANDPGNQHAVSRSCSLTLLVFVASGDAEQEVLERFGRVARDYPCRLVVMNAQPDAAPAGLSARVSVQCYMPDAGKKEVCCDQVTVLARGEAVNGIDQVVLPLLVPGLPVYLWWRVGRFAPEGHLDLILRSVDRVLLDSARFPDPDSDLPLLLEVVRKLPPQVVLTDLNWARLTPWREVIAQCFDAPDTRPYLDRVAEVRIEYERKSPRVHVHRAQALLLIGWLASRLGWEPTAGAGASADGGRAFTFRGRKGNIRVERLPRDFEGGGGGVCFALTMKTADATPAVFSVGRGPDGRTAVTRLELPGQPPVDRAARVEVHDEFDLLKDELRFAARDRVYEQALAVVGRRA